VKRAAFAVIFFAATSAFAQKPDVAYVTVDSIAVRFHAPDTGGVASPRFITERQLSFESRLFAFEDDPSGVIQDRHVRAAIDTHIAEEMLGALPLDNAPSAQLAEHAVDIVRKSMEQRVGGHAVIERAEKLDGIEPRELDVIIEREARALLYVDAQTPMLSPSEDQLRETYRTTSHPFRGRTFEDCKDDLERWFVIERFRSALQGYLQTARARVNIVYF
jgi:hypothetical protein